MQQLDTEFDADEYNDIFPFEQEYNAWISSLERDFIDEVNYRAQIAAQQDRDNFYYVYDDETEDEFSPFVTVNS